MAEGIVNRKRIATAIVLVLLGACGHSTVNYSATCVRCLQHGYGYVRSIFGIPYWNRFVLSQNPGGIMSPAVFSPGVAQIDPSLYEVIVGQRCKHDFQRGGFCRSGLGIIACGTYGASRQYVPRTELIEQTYRAYLRVPEKSLARETYQLLDSILPIDMADSPQRRVQLYQYSPEKAEARTYHILNDGLALVTTSQEWHQLLQTIHNPANTNLTLPVDRSTLIQRLKDPRAEVRMKALDQLAARNEPEAWTAVAEALTDALLRDRAVKYIVAARQWPHLAAALRQKPPVGVPEAYGDRRLDGRREVGRTYDEPFLQLAKSLSPDEIRALLKFQDPDVDRFCLATIRLQYRFDFLEDALGVLNRTGTQDAADTVEDLLLGPEYFGERLYILGKPTRRDAWAYLQTAISDTPVSQMSLTRLGQRGYQQLQDAKHICQRTKPESWPELQKFRDDRITRHDDAWIAAAVAQTMYNVDPDRTRDYLNHQLKSLPSEDKIARQAIASVGQIADPAFLSELEALQSRLNKYNSSTYHRALAYALHRCRGIQHWKLSRRADGSYEIQKPAVSTAHTAQR